MNLRAFNPKQFLEILSSFELFSCVPQILCNFTFVVRGAGTYLNILWTNQVYLKLGVDKIQK